MKRILAILCVMYAGSAMAGSAGQSLTGGQAIGSVDGLGSSADTEVTYNCSGAICGDPDLTFDGTTTTMAAQIILPNDGSNAIDMDDNPVGAGGFADCAANPPAAGDARLALDSSVNSGELFICLPDGLKYEFAKFDQSEILSCPDCDWELTKTGVARYKSYRFFSAAKDPALTNEFAQISASITGTDDDDWNAALDLKPGTSNGATFSQITMLSIDPLAGVTVRSADSIGGAAASLTINDLDNSRAITIVVPDVIATSRSYTIPEVPDGNFVMSTASVDGNISITDPDPVDADDHYWFKFDHQIVLTGIECIVDGTTSIAVTIQACDFEGASCANTDAIVTCDADGATDAATTTIGADNWVRILYAAPSGTPTFVNMTLQFTRPAT